MTTPAVSSRTSVIFTAGCSWACMSARVHPPHVPSGVSQDSQQKPIGAQSMGDVCIPWAVWKCLLTGKSVWFLSCTMRSLTKKMSFLGFTSIYVSVHACSAVSDSLQPHGLQPTRLLSPWIFQVRILEGLPFPAPEDLPSPGIEPVSLTPPTLAGRFFTTGTTCKPTLFGLITTRLSCYI